MACLKTFAKCFNARSLLSIIPCLKKDLGAIRGVPNSKYFQYSASPCLVPMTNSNLEFCWCQMDLLRSPVTFLLGSFGGLAGSLGVIFKISSSSTNTVSTKAISIAFSTIAWSNFIVDILIWLYHIKQANDHHFHQIMELTSQVWHHTKHHCCLGSCLTLQ